MWFDEERLLCLLTVPLEVLELLGNRFMEVSIDAGVAYATAIASAAYERQRLHGEDVHPAAYRMRLADNLAPKPLAPPSAPVGLQ
jgi:hypothetical protein